MKKIYSALSSIALLFSLPALAGPLAEKSIEPKSAKEDNRERSEKDSINAEKTPKLEASSPLCRTGG